MKKNITQISSTPQPLLKSGHMLLDYVLNAQLFPIQPQSFVLHLKLLL